MLLEAKRFGQMKYHCCDAMYGHGSETCRRDSLPTDEECQDFFAAKNTPDDVPSVVSGGRGPLSICGGIDNPFGLNWTVC
jgi:hypothetical protein